MSRFSITEKVLDWIADCTEYNHCSVLDNETKTNLYQYHQELLDWVNETLETKIEAIEDLRTGAAYCQLMHMLYPRSVPLKKVKFCTDNHYEYLQNFKFLLVVFKEKRAEMTVPFRKLMEGNFKEHVKFLRWFKRYFENNYNGHWYDPVLERNGASICFVSKHTKSLSDAGSLNEHEIASELETTIATVTPSTSTSATTVVYKPPAETKSPMSTKTPQATGTTPAPAFADDRVVEETKDSNEHNFNKLTRMLETINLNMDRLESLKVNLET